MSQIIREGRSYFFYFSFSSAVDDSAFCSVAGFGFGIVEFTKNGSEGGSVARFWFSLNDYFEVGTVKRLDALTIMCDLK